MSGAEPPADFDARIAQVMLRQLGEGRVFFGTDSIAVDHRTFRANASQLVQLPVSSR